MKDENEDVTIKIVYDKDIKSVSEKGGEEYEKENCSIIDGGSNDGRVNIGMRQFHGYIRVHGSECI
ncbi:hypothetical protein, partial [Eisenbergiella massiliensis]|uniref:hypothetical protein n=1 Tax=Eisenbergiella massiliensis TaxID=1720294 RepID=UPI00249268D3